MGNVTGNADAKQIFSITAKVRWSDVDRLSHANNQAYWRWCEDVRNSQALVVGLGQPSPERPSQIVVTSQAEYLAPLSLDDEIVITRKVVGFGRTSHEAEYTIWHDKTVVFRATCKIVLYDFAEKRAVPYSDNVRKEMLAGAG